MKYYKLYLPALVSVAMTFMYLIACNKDKYPDPNDALQKSISVSFSREVLLQLLEQTGPNEMAGICFAPVEEGDKMNLIAMPAEWNTSENEPNEMIKLMDRGIKGQITNDPVASFTVSGTEEFEFVFLEKNALLHFLNEAHFYPGELKTPSGIHMSRIMLDLNTGNEAQKYRSIIAKPYPLPNLDNGFKEREGIGYLVPPACPPLWIPK